MSAIGRPKQFDRDEALEKAMELFWTRGYEATGLRELLDHMGIGRQSLYDTFGDKHSLFVEAVNHYSQCVTQGIVDGLEAEGSPLENIRKTLMDSAKSASEGRCRGCLLTNTLVESAPHDQEVADAARTVLGRLETSFRRTLQRAVDERELPGNTNVRALARFFTSTLQGMAVMVSSSASRATLNDIANVAMSVLDT